MMSSRQDWDNHEPRMWSRASGLSDDQLTSFAIEDDLVEVRAGATAYGTISELGHTTVCRDYLIDVPTSYSFWKD
jgi:hypothetical protein